MAERLYLPPSLRHVLTLIALAIRFRAFLDRKSNTSLSSHKTILELSLLFTDLYWGKTMDHRTIAYKNQKRG